MDRRTWLQLITILAAAREANAQQRGGAATPPAEGAGRGGRGQGGFRICPCASPRNKWSAALKLIGLEFQDAGDRPDAAAASTRRSAITNRCARSEVPIDTEPAFAFHPGLPDREPIKGPQRFETTIPQDARGQGAVEPGGSGVLARDGPGAADALARGLFHGPHEDVPGAHEEVFAQTAVPDHAHRGSGAGRRRPRPTGDQGGQVRGPLHGIPFGRERPVRHQGHPHHLGRGAVTRSACPRTTPPAWSACAKRARC